MMIKKRPQHAKGCFGISLSYPRLAGKVIETHPALAIPLVNAGRRQKSQKAQRKTKTRRTIRGETQGTLLLDVFIDRPGLENTIVAHEFY
jgi:hypothetical protein